MHAHSCLASRSAGVFLLDKGRKVLVQSRVDERGDTHNIEKTVTEAGLAGFVAKSGQVLNELDILRIRTADGTDYDPNIDFINEELLTRMRQDCESSSVPLLMAPGLVVPPQITITIKAQRHSNALVHHFVMPVLANSPQGKSVRQPQHGEVVGVIFALQKTATTLEEGTRYFDDCDESGLLKLAVMYALIFTHVNGFLNNPCEF